MSFSPHAFSGYRAFSGFVASDTELSLYRTFYALSSRNLLYLQSSLLVLENRFKELDEEDLEHLSIDNFLSAKCCETFTARAKELPREAERVDLILEAKKQVKEYHEALLLHSEVLKFSKPNQRVWRVFRGWFETVKPFVGYGNHLLQQPDDFVALKPSPDPDFLGRFLQNLGGKCLPGARHTTSSEVKYYSSAHISRLVTVITVFGASLVIEGATVTLYVVQNEHVRLGLIALFTNLFAASLAIITDGRRTDIILATAACAAVLVVFVSQIPNIS